MTNREKLEELGIDLTRIKGLHGKVLCPECSHTRRNKKEPCLSVNIDAGKYNCHNGCGFSGNVNEPEEKKDYPKPVYVNRTELPKNMVDWFAGRGITPQTLLDFRIGFGNVFMPQVGAERMTVQFNYFRNDELINIKYRDGAKNFRMVKDAELIFYNLDAIKGATECVIVEGEMDCLSWHQAGYRAVISVPNGASGSTDDDQQMIFLDNCWRYFRNMTRIYLATDDDEKGRILQTELARRLGIERCRKVDFDGYKDSNELLVARGDRALIDRLTVSQEFPIEGVFTIKDVYDELMDIFHNGLPDGDKTGDVVLDMHIRFMPGEVSMITGIPSHGKSIWLDQTALKLSLNAGWKFALFSPESYPMPLYFSRLTKFLTGRKFSKNHLTEQQVNYVSEWIKDRFNLILPQTEGFTIDSILAKAKMLVLRKGIKGLIIDPWNRIEQTRTGNDERKFIQQTLTKIINFAQTNGVHCFVVAHPTKMQKEKDSQDYVVPNLYSISGSADYYNMTQNGITVFRHDDPNSPQVTEVHIQKVKWEHLGKKGVVEYVYNENNARLVAPGTDPDVSWLTFPDGMDFPAEILPASAMLPNHTFEYQIPDDDIPF